MSHVMCHVSRHMSRVTCHMSRVTCHMSQFYLFIFFFSRTKWWSLSVEGLLSTGPTPSSFINWFILSFQTFKTPSHPNHKSQGPEIFKECSPPSMCCMSGVRCHVLCVRCHMYLFLQSCWASLWRVYYQRGLPCPVLLVIDFLEKSFTKKYSANYKVQNSKPKKIYNEYPIFNALFYQSGVIFYTERVCSYVC